jgi:hypothetical protein
MIKHVDEVPVTYLNKGQAYQISIVNTHPPQSGAPQRYRTFIRISFDDESQRDKPSACWQLWKEGRGTNEAHQRGGKLQAVEFVDPAQHGEEDPSKAKPDLEYASFDGFSVQWTPLPHGPAECTIIVRFNFLSTDFSHSKGVKGIPVRLCAKTEQLNDGSPRSPTSKPEVAFCKVKLFRDHGAERKLSNDVAHVRKTMDKLQNQIAQLDSGLRDPSKKKRSSLSLKGPPPPKPGKVKHKRTWSMSSASSSGANAQKSVEDDLHLRLATMKDMFSSTRPVSILSLLGDPADDPDLFPVQLNMESAEIPRADLKDASWDGKPSAIHTTRTSSLTSHSPSSTSLQSANSSALHLSRQVSAQEQSEWQIYQQHHHNSVPDLAMAARQSDSPVKISRSQPDHTGQLSGWIQAIGIDPSYQPPAEPVIKPSKQTPC